MRSSCRPSGHGIQSIIVAIIIVVATIVRCRCRWVVAIKWHQFTIDGVIVPCVVTGDDASISVEWIFHEIEVYKDPKGEAALASAGGGAAPSWKLAFLIDNVSKVTLGMFDGLWFHVHKQKALVFLHCREGYST